MKKILCIVLAFAFCFGVVGCGNSNVSVGSEFLEYATEILSSVDNYLDGEIDVKEAKKQVSSLNKRLTSLYNEEYSDELYIKSRASAIWLHLSKISTEEISMFGDYAKILDEKKELVVKRNEFAELLGEKAYRGSSNTKKESDQATKKETDDINAEKTGDSKESDIIVDTRTKLLHNTNIMYLDTNFRIISLDDLIEDVETDEMVRDLMSEDTVYQEVFKDASFYKTKNDVEIAGVRFYPALYTFNDNKLWLITYISYDGESFDSISTLFNQAFGESEIAIEDEGTEHEEVTQVWKFDFVGVYFAEFTVTREIDSFVISVVVVRE